MNLKFANKQIEKTQKETLALSGRLCNDRVVSGNKELHQFLVLNKQCN